MDADAALTDLATRRARLVDAMSATRAASRSLLAATADADAAASAAVKLSATGEQMDQEIATLKAEKEEFIRRGLDVRGRRADTTAEGKRLDAALAALESEHAQCPTCRQGLDDAAALITETERMRAAALAGLHQLDTEHASLLREVEEVTGKLAACQGRVAQIEKANQHAEQMHTYAHRAGQDFSSTLLALAGLIDVELHDLAVAEEQVKKRVDTLDRRAAELAEFRRARRAVGNAERDVAAAAQACQHATERTVVAPDPEQVENAIIGARELRVKSDAAAAEAASSMAVFHAASTGFAQLENLADIAQDQWDRKQKAVRDAEIAQASADLLQAYRQDLIADFTDGISVAATDLMARFGGEHIGFHLGPDFVPQVELADGRMRKTALLSGGEKARAGLAFRLGISMQISDTGLPTQVIGDEVTQFLDDAGRRQVIATIAELFDAPILVSHTDEILDVATTIHRLERAPLGDTSTTVAVAA